MLYIGGCDAWYNSRFLVCVCYNAGMEITLSDVLAARDRRAAYQTQLLKRYKGACLAVFTVVTPGSDKQTPESQRLFNAGVRAIVRIVKRYEMVPLLFEAHEYPTGNEAYLAVKTDPYFLKMELCKLEESAPYGRLWDMDVIGADGVPIERERVGFDPRGCIVCGKSGRSCASRRLHTEEDVQASVRALTDTLPDE